MSWLDVKNVALYTTLIWNVTHVLQLTRVKIIHFPFISYGEKSLGVYSAWIKNMHQGIAVQGMNVRQQRKS